MLKYVARASLIMLPCLLWAGTDISGSRSGCWYAAREVSDSHLLKNSSFPHTIMVHNAEQGPGAGCSCHANCWLGRCYLLSHIIWDCSWLTQNKKCWRRNSSQVAVKVGRGPILLLAQPSLKPKPFSSLWTRWLHAQAPSSRCQEYLLYWGLGKCYSLAVCAPSFSRSSFFQEKGKI